MSAAETQYFTDVYRLWLFRVIDSDAEVYDCSEGRWEASQELFDTWNDAACLIEVFRCDSCTATCAAVKEEDCRFHV